MRIEFETVVERVREGVRRRGLPFLLALLIELLIALMIVYLGASVVAPKKKEFPKVFGIAGQEEDSSDATKSPETRKAEAQATRRGATQQAAQKPIPVPTPPPQTDQPPPTPYAFLHLTRSDYAASDIGRNKSAAPVAAGDSASSDDNGSSGIRAGDTPRASGKGPHGEPLYYAEWYREPTHAELNTYLPPKSQRDGWGEVACRTIDHWHVEDCIELGESPRASGYARAVRQAAWQFLVRPPRVGGKVLVGSWVNIRITYTFTPADAPADTPAD
ncbi:hypothetical protein [Sphingomonas sp.]|uniref:hypothetical protein n=1 Tax=Sphingomonas sp. TaxID=28214 RepID=UPI001B1EFE28|nr:hypothetical protein [Sphingomonas sp.]MBO9715137.1 hypothetical protein [Sphingomonas sp.]